MKNKTEPFPHSGIVLVDKPKGWTSHDVVNFIRGRFNVKKVGHCGTLDPAATGLLVIVLGHATKMSQQLSGSDKTYEGTVLFGKETRPRYLSDFRNDILLTYETSTRSLSPELIEVSESGLVTVSM